MFARNSNPVVVGHRGAGAGIVVSSRGPVGENTIDSARTAVDAGARWVEVDVVATADDQLVLSHDLRTTDGSLIEATVFAALDRVETLEALFAALPAEVGVVVDVKASPARRTHTATVVAAALHREAAQRQLVVYGAGNDTTATLTCALAGTGVVVGVFGTAGTGLGTLLRSALAHGAGLIAAHTSSVLGPVAATVNLGATRALLDAAHAAGLEVLIYTPDRREADALAGFAVDAVCVDHLIA